MNINIKKYAKLLFITMVSICLVLIFIFYFCFYPLKYKTTIQKYSSEFNVKNYVVASVICVESGFDNNAVSSKGAIGLMQLMPSTAQWLAQKLGEDYSEQKLYNAEFNIKLGTYYLSYLLQKFKNEDTAIIAYNAGEGVVSLWLKNSEYSLDGKVVNNIPYTETKKYLAKVNRLKQIYFARF
ncbi:MAG: lytic transglycosylase domain-containing protein [Clostridiales bacterium]|nr:lytic transglycosylase domain-containing protein [Clostridiales bacterium]